MLLTIQLKRRPYSALATASRTSSASLLLWLRVIVSPRATIPDVVNASQRSWLSTPRSDATETYFTEFWIQLMERFIVI